jgi:hypothetical protein
LCTSLRQNNTLAQLRLAHNHIKNEQAELLAVVLEEKAAHAGRIESKGSSTSNGEGGVAIALTNLDLDNNEIYSEVLGRLKIASQRMAVLLSCEAIGRLGAKR